MLKQFTPFKFTRSKVPVDRPRFEPCAPSQTASIGFVNHDNGQPVIAGFELLTLETKAVPSELVKRKAAIQADKVLHETGRRPKGKALREIKEGITRELLAHAFPKRKTVPVLWLDGLALVGSTSMPEVDRIASLLVACDSSLALGPLETKVAPGTALTMWASAPQDGPASLAVGRNLTVEGDDGKATFKNTSVKNPEVVEAIRAKGAVTSLSLATERGVDFTLTDALQFKGIALSAARCTPC